MMNYPSLEWRLARRPSGTPDLSDVELVETKLPAPGRGEVLVRNTAMSVEPYMWGRMTGQADYAAPYELGAPMTGHAVGTVIASGASALPEGTLVLHEAGWREAAVLPAAEVRPIDAPDLAPSVWLGALGLTGLTAWVGLVEIARCRPGDTVFVSAAAGAVGSTAAQLAKTMGCTVIGSAGGAAKVEFLTGELGLDAAFSYRDGPVRSGLSDALTRVGQDGLDVYFDNVGGEHLEAAIRRMRDFGRIALCGAISTYGSRAPGPSNLLLAIWRRLRLEGFIATDHTARRPDFERMMAAWLRDGRVRSVETVRTGGIREAFAALLGMLRGQDVGKTVVTLGE
jgi:NADPH-dependent curcumin reductase CurA